MKLQKIMVAMWRSGKPPLEECYELSKAVVRYVARTLETIVLNRGAGWNLCQ